MVKWADYLISQVSYDSNHCITKVKQHKDNGNKISEGEIVDRNTVTGNLGHGAKYMTMFGDLGKIRIGKNVRYFRAYEDHYIRIDNNKVTSDNLGEIPQLDESQQEEKSALPETKPTPDVETKPLSALSSAFFSEQVEEEQATEVESEVTPEPAEVESEVTPKEDKKKIVEMKLSTKKKSTKKKPAKKKSTKKKPAKKKSTKKKRA